MYDDAHCKLTLFHIILFFFQDDKPVNEFGFDEKFLDKKECEKVIEETHEAWKKLRSGETEAGKLWTGKE